MMHDVSFAGMSKSVERQIIREYSKSVFHHWDRNFLIILVIAVILESMLVTFMSRRPIKEYSEAEIARIQERFANFILQEETKQEIDTDILSTTGEGVNVVDESAESSGDGAAGDAAEGGEEAGNGSRSLSAEERQAARMSSAESRRRSREAISRSVSSKGLLGLLASSGSSAQGEAVQSFLSGSGTEGTGRQDLDQILSSVSGLKTQGASGLNGEGGGGGLDQVRGSRTERRTSIDDLVTDLGSARSESLSRRGELKVETPADLQGTGKKSMHRSPEAIQEVLLSHVAAIRYCYERELKRNPALKGKVTVRITVNPEGRVKNVSILSSTLNNDRVERCMLARIRLWKDFKPIDPSDGDVTFRYAYTFGY